LGKSIESSRESSLKDSLSRLGERRLRKSNQTGGARISGIQRRSLETKPGGLNEIIDLAVQMASAAASLAESTARIAHNLRVFMTVRRYAFERMLLAHLASPL
jgi:hypothetical protein